MRNLPGSTYDVHERFKLGMHAKQERDERLNYSNDTVFLTHVYLFVLQPNKSFFYRSGACFDAILFITSTSSSQSN